MKKQNKERLVMNEKLLLASEKHLKECQDYARQKPDEKY
jgi:hypothetical protein